MVCLTAKAQDVIVLQNAEEIEAKVEAIAQDLVTYRRWSNLDGPTYTIEKSQIFYIKYQNGEKDLFSAATTANSTPPATGSVAVKKAVDPIVFSGYVNLGTVFNAEGAGPTFDISIGMKIYERLYLGIATGFHACFTPYELYYYNGYYSAYTEGTLFEAYIPIGANLKCYMTKNRKVNPYINCTLGGFVGVGENMAGFNGFHCQAGLGLDIKRFTIGVGYNALVKYGTAHCGYVKLGVRFGK